jgi:uncharacterized repeat protein (TIGR01451 family)
MLLVCCGGHAQAQQTAITRSARFTGNINFVATGGSLRTQPNTGDACAVGASSSQNLSGIPAGASILAAYLYWGGSGATADNTVTLNGNTITASRTFAATFSNAGTDYPFFGGFADVTARVSGNGAFTFANLTVNTGAPFCASQAVAAGWGLIVIYQSASERLRAINVFDGLQYFRGSALTLTPDGFRVPTSNIDGRMAIVAWEGDPQNSTPLNGFAEALSFNGAALDDGINVPGSDPLVQPFDGTVNSQGVANSYGVDVDTFDVSALLAPGQTTATSVFSAGGDLVLLTAQIVSVTTEPVVDLAVAKSHVGNFSVGTSGAYTIHVSNVAGFEKEDNTVTVTDTLPAGLGFVSATGTGWTCGASAQIVTCAHPPSLTSGASFPDITLTVSVSASAAASVTNSVTVTSASRDTNAANNTASDVTTVTRAQPQLSVQKVSQVLSDPINLATNPKRIPQSVTRYSITVTNQGPGAVDASSLVITDPVPASTAVYVSTASGDPVEFIDGTTASGLAFSYATNVSYSNQPGGGTPFSYVPTPDASGFDAAVTGIRIAPSGVMNAAAGGNTPSFTVRFRVRVP